MLRVKDCRHTTHESTNRGTLTVSIIFRTQDISAVMAVLRNTPSFKDCLNQIYVSIDLTILLTVD